MFSLRPQACATLNSSRVTSQKEQLPAMFSAVMAKGRNRRSARSEKVQVGCMWCLIRMFDFRRSPHLLSDRNHGVNGHSVRSELKISEDLCDAASAAKFKENGAEKVRMGKPSIKALMQEEMASMQPLKQIPTDEIRKSIAVLQHELLEETNQLKSVNPTEGTDIDLNLAASLMEIYKYHNKCQNIGDAVESSPASSSTANGKHIDPSNHDACPDRNPSIIQKALEDVAEAVISHQSADRKRLPSNDAARSKEFVNALQLLSSNKELFLKLLQDPNSHLLECLQNLYTSLGSPTLEPVETSSLKQPEVSTTEPVNKHRRHSSFWKEDRLIMRKPSKLNDSPQGFSRIVILKPSPARDLNSLSTNSASSSPQSNGSLHGRADGDKVGHQFSLRELKRRLRLAISENRKDHHLSSMDGVLHRAVHGLEDSDDTSKLLPVENLVTSLASKDSLDTENAVVQPSADNETKRKDCQCDPENESSRRVGAFSYEEAKKHLIERLEDQELDDSSRIVGAFSYEEAKKHLVERLEDQELNDSSRIVHKSESLGRLISFSENDIVPLGDSPNKEEEINLSQVETVSSSPWQQTKQEDDPRSPSRQNQETCNMTIKFDEQLAEFKTELGNALFEEGSSSQEADQEETKEASNVVENLPLGLEIQNLSDSFTKENVHNGPLEAPESVSMALAPPRDSPKDIVKEHDELNTSTVLESAMTCASTFPCSPENISDKEEQPSPVSVLDSFLGDNTSPSHKTTKLNEPAMQHSRILFKELETPSVSPTLCNRPNKAILEDSEARFAFIRAVLEASGLLTLEENSQRWHIDDTLVDPSLFVEVGISYCLADDADLLFDCIGEVLVDIRDKFFSVSPRLSFLNHIVRRAPLGENLIQEVAKRIDWLLDKQFPNALDQAVMEDLESGNWMNLRSDSESVLVEALDDILDDSLEEMVFDLWL